MDEIYTFSSFPMTKPLAIMPDQVGSSSVVLLFSCPDRRGLVARISGIVYEAGGNIIDLDEHVDPVDKAFFIRIEWSMEGDFLLEDLQQVFGTVAETFGAKWSLRLAGRKTRAAIFVSRYDHCLQELLWRERMGEFPVQIPLVVSNHADLGPLVRQHGIPFHHIPVTAANRQDAEAEQLRLVREYQSDVVVLARYMQILSPSFVGAMPGRIINIHHSFLPAFVGGNPYRQAYDRGVKLIGATSHYVTEELDEGPIIEQDIVRVSHRDGLPDLVRKGRDLERLVLARALRLHCEHRIILNGRKTVVFE